MDNGSEKGFPPSKSSIASLTPSRSSSTVSVDDDENDSSQYQMIPKFENHKKMVAKHFMSPTISAAAKAVSPRKKILGERNDNPVNFYSQNLGAEKISQSSVIDQSDLASSLVVSSYSYAAESDDKGDTDSSAKGYESLTNYLTPRPKYLRFNPSRRSEILNRLVNEGISLNGLIDSQEVSDEDFPLVDKVEHSSFSANESSVRLKSGENAEKVDEIVNDEYKVEEEEEEEEEVKGERGWCLRGVLKHILMFIACLMFMSYISPMNSPSPLPAQQALWNSTDDYLWVREQALDFTSTKMYNAAGFLGVEVVGGKYSRVTEEVRINEDYDDRDGEEMAEANGEILEGQDGDKKDDGDETEGKRADEFEFEGDSFEQMMGAEVNQSGDDIDDSLFLEMEVESEAVDAEIFGAGELESEVNGFGLFEDAKASESEDVAGGYALENEEIYSTKVKEFQPSEIPKDDGATLQEEFKQNESSGSSEELPILTDSGNEYDETAGYDHGAEMQKLRWSISAVVGVFGGTLLLAASAFIYRSKKPRSIAKESKAAVKKPKQSKVAEEERVVTTTVPPPMERKVEFLARSSFSHPASKAPIELNYRAHAPTVELIGEIVFGGRRSSTNKFQVNESFKESNAIYSKPGSLPQPVSTPIQTSAFAYSPSYASIAATEQKFLKKEGGQSGEATIQSTTPLRRSSRLRSRASAMSP